MEDMLYYAAEDCDKYREGFVDGANRALNKVKLQVELYNELEGVNFDELLEYIEEIRSGLVSD